MIIATAPTNLAVQELAEKVYNQVKLQNGNLIFLQSIANELISESEQTRQAWQTARLSEILQKHLKAEVPDADTPFIKRYISRRILHDGNAYKEDEALAQAIAIHKPRIICGTVPMVRTALEVWNNKFSPDELLHLIVDKAGLLPEMFLFVLISFLPNIQKLLFIGDYKQSPPYVGATPQRTVYLGHEGALHKLARNVSLKHITLTKNFRSHPRMVEAISAASYDGILRPAQETWGRTMWSELGSPAPNHEVPFLFPHTTGKEQLTQEKSWVNDLHNELAVQMNQFILQRQPDAQVVILCYYNASVRDIEQRQPGVKVFSINRYQGGECDFAIIVTARVHSAEKFRNVDFVLDPQRTTVAIMRAREGIFIIGEQDILDQSPVWKTFIDKFSCVRSFLIEFYDWLAEYKHRVTAKSFFARKLR